ncbi:helix-turn-helix domain-containing protein [Faecalicoccus pleomorphus]|uniref:helix-turn-helix domain-containing protein n=1 Tax=Faecalicoccus pleomorphus TaxID=1323 RepID=UPI001960283A|nr:helix-turn-helix transcriptional regulator [Faecalicoccus pleomorphus]MBM6807793.1 helix-turn-helix transcriptional regulator [Faecalicoccus pleomorphus]
MNNIIDYKKIGDRIRKSRKEKKITQSQLCTDLNISLYHYSKIENAHVSASLETLVEIADYLGLTIEYLLSGTSKINPTYYDEELFRIMEKCNASQKKLIIEMAKLILKTNINDVHIKQS